MIISIERFILLRNKKFNLEKKYDSIIIIIIINENIFVVQAKDEQ